MRKIYFILFGAVLVVLILLVDWREKFDAIVRRRPAALPGGEALGHLVQPETASLIGVDSLSEVLPEDWTAGDPEALPTATDFSDLGLENDPRFTQPGLPSQSTAPATRTGPSLLSADGAPISSRAASPAKGLQVRSSFQDVPQQPYLDESRQLLRQTVRNYERISPAPGTPAKDRQP